MPRKRGRPLSAEWMETSAIALKLGVSPEHLLRLRTELFTPGTHYRVKNPQASSKGRRYLWHLAKVEQRLASE